jgi:cytochrome c oxidase subunit 3
VFVTLVFLAGLMAVIAWWLVKQTINVEPWEAQLPFARGSAWSLPLEKTGLWVLLAVITSLFCLLVSAYAMRMHHHGDWRSLPEPGLLWVNTGLLILSSVFMQRARNAAEREALVDVRAGLNAGGVFALAFMIGQLLAWRQLNASGYFIASNPANAFFYMITGLHGLHLLGGLVAWGRSLARVWRGAEAAEVRLGVELCTTYWHFLLVVWLVLFGLMLST